MRLYEFKSIRTKVDLDILFKECQKEAGLLYQKYLEDKRIDSSTPHPATVLENEIDELLHGRS
jgi:uncharacterized protein YbcV (DUF1398 family)